jgi:hypothetical protein
MTTKWMTMVCPQCEAVVELTPEFQIWNFQDETFAHPIGYCSMKCCEIAGQVKMRIKERAGA